MKFLHRIQQGILAVGLGVLLGGSFAESQAATLTTQSNNIYKLSWQGKWEKDGRASLTADILRNHLSNLKDPLTNAPRVGDCFKELGRLLLAQGLDPSSYYNCPDIPDSEEEFCYLHDNPDNSGPNYINGQRAGSLCKTQTLLDLTDHLFDHGHLGWHPDAGPIGNSGANTVVQVDPQVAPRGIFNIDPTIRERIGQALATNQALINGDFILSGSPALSRYGRQGYGVDTQNQQVNASPIFINPNLEEAAINLITCLFSSNTFESVNFGRIEYVRNSRTNARFNIYATYNGGPIQGINYTHPTVLPLPPTNCLGLQSNGIPTNRICLVVGVNSGRIYIASLYPEG